MKSLKIEMGQFGILCASMYITSISPGAGVPSSCTAFVEGESSAIDP